MRTVADVCVMDAAFTATDQLQGVHLTAGMTEWRGASCLGAVSPCLAKSSGCTNHSWAAQARRGSPDFFQGGDLACRRQRRLLFAVGNCNSHHVVAASSGEQQGILLSHREGRGASP